MQSNRMTARGVLCSVLCVAENHGSAEVIVSINWTSPAAWCSDDDYVRMPAAEVVALLGKPVEATIEFEPASDGEEWDIVELKEIEV